LLIQKNKGIFFIARLYLTANTTDSKLFDFIKFWRLKLDIEIKPQKILIKLLYLIFFLLFANLTGIVSKFYFNHGSVYGLVRLFDFNREANIPTFYSSLALISCSILLAFISLSHKRHGSSYIPWGGLSIIFLFLSIDEITTIHERMNDPIHELLNTSGLLYFAWIIPYGLALLLFFGIYLKFLINLPKKFLHLFIISGATFIAGAIGIESLCGWYCELLGGKHGLDNFPYAIFYTCEEFLEMLGIVFFIYTLLLYIVTELNYSTISIIKNEKSII